MKYTNIHEFIKVMPSLYENSTTAFWDDAHISKSMLEAHLNPTFDGASRNMEFVDKSVKWISKFKEGGKLLDLGCGPGLYASRLAYKGLKVTGIDFSKRSIEYGKEQAKMTGQDINYYYQNYLDIEYEEEFDLIILIYCDLGVLSPENRKRLLKKSYNALKKSGIIILDVHSMRALEDFKECEHFRFENGGFWALNPYLLLERNKYYAKTANTLEQYVVVQENTCNNYNIWNQLYSQELLKEEVSAAGFENIMLYDDVAGTAYSGNGKTICAVGVK